MKTKLRKVLLVFFICSSAIQLHAQIKTLEIEANALIEDKNAKEYAIVVYSDGKLLDSIYCKKAKKVALSLDCSKVYSLVFKKANYDDKIVMVNTKIPKGLRELIEDPFILQVELAKISTSNNELTDYPVAVLSVNKRVKSLMASENYYKMTHE